VDYLFRPDRLCRKKETFGQLTEDYKIFTVKYQTKDAKQSEIKRVLKNPKPSIQLLVSLHCWLRFQMIRNL